MLTKNRILLIGLLVCLMATLAAGSIAYFTAEETARNVITTGKLDIELVEIGADGLPFPEEGVKNVMPGDEVVKKVTVKNLGTVDTFVRIAVEKSIVGADGETLDPSVVLPQLNEADWAEQDGWYYYKKILAAGEETSPLFETVIMDPVAMDNPYMDATIFVDVTVQAVQSRNNGDDPLAAQGWPVAETVEPEENV